MRIGILTSSIAGNYGGIMQNYALQQVLKLWGHIPITIDHYKPYSRVRWILGRIKGLLKSSKIDVPFPWYGRVGSKKILRFAFRNIDRTNSVRLITSDIINRNKLDAIIVGSDQVWRLKYNNIEASFLSFAEGYDLKRIAYSASFGVEQWDYPESLTKRCKELVEKFDAVSVREKSDVELCANNLGIKVTHTLDPTLLLSNDSYVEICKDVPRNPNKYLFAYILDPSFEKQALVEQFAAKRGLSLTMRNAENNLKKDDSIESWLACFRDTDFVITDSYHGTLFSIIFNKDFLTINNHGRGQSRFKSILGQLELLDRFTDGCHIVDELVQIDWDRVNKILAKEKSNSLEYLSKALST